MIALTATVATIVVTETRSQDGPLTGFKEECASIGIDGYNDFISKISVDVPFEPFDSSPATFYASDSMESYCSARPDEGLHDPGDEVGKITPEYHSAMVNRLSIKINYGDSHFSSELNIDGGTADHEENIKGWDFAIPGVLEVYDEKWTTYIDTLRGVVTSVYELENLQVVIELTIRLEQNLNTANDEYQAIVALNQEVAEGIRDRAIERREG
jgi:hypothetical protein